jgi:hypothetical protein
MEKIIRNISNEFRGRLKQKMTVLIIAGLCLIFSTPSFAANTVKRLSGKALKKIEAKYDKETRKLFSGKTATKTYWP